MEKKIIAAKQAVCMTRAFGTRDTSYGLTSFIKHSFTPQGQMVFFLSGSHGMSSKPIFWIFLRLVLLFEIYLGVKILLQHYLYIWRYKGVKVKNKIRIAKKNLFLT